MKAVRRMIARLRGALDLNAADDRLSREMQSHLEFATAEFIQRGMNPDEAHRAALLEARGMTQAQEAYRDQRGIPAIQSIDRHVRQAARGLRRNRSYAAAILLSVALGIGLNTAIFSVLDAVVRRPLPYPDASRIMTFGISSHRAGDPAPTIRWEPYAELKEWRESRIVGPIADFAERSGVVQGEQTPEFVRGGVASANLLQLLRVKPLLGRWFTDGEDPRVVVISEALWQRQFARDTGVLGRTLKIEGEASRVIGVMPKGMGLPIGAQFWMPSAGVGNQAIARKPEGIAPAAIIADLERLSTSIQRSRSRGVPMSVIMMPLEEQLFGPAKPTLRILFVAALALLLIACANVTNLTLARALERRRELALRMALGASARSLGALVLVENVILTVGGGILGVVFAIAASRLLAALAPPSLTLARDVSVQSASLRFAIGLIVACCIVVSTAPIIQVGRRSANEVIGNSGRAGPARSMKTARRALVVAQLALALVLLTESGLLISSIRRLTRPERLGFTPHGVVILNARLFGDSYRSVAGKQAFVTRLVGRIREIPGVDQVTVGPPPAVGGSGVRGLTEGFDMIFMYQRDPSSPNLTFWAKVVDENYAATFGTRLRSGRFFRATDDSSATRVALLNASAAREFFGSENPVGRTLPATGLSGGKAPGPTVIGVVDDALQMDLTVESKPEVLLSARQTTGRPRATIAVHSSLPPATLVPMLNGLIREIDPSLAASRLQSMDDVIDESMARHRFVLRLLFVFATLGVALAAIGLYGVISYFVMQRSSEFGVRMALGARQHHVIQLVLVESAVMTAIGVLVAVPIAVASGRLLETLLYQAKTTGPVAFLGATGLLTLVALGASFLPAHRAGAVDPARALRAE